MQINYENDAVVEVEDLSKTLLEISIESRIPHWHACGGNARCSTCRIIVLNGGENLLPRYEKETALAQKRGSRKTSGSPVRPV